MRSEEFVFVYEAGEHIGRKVKYGTFIEGILESVEYGYDDEYVVQIDDRVYWFDKFVELVFVDGL